MTLDLSNNPLNTKITFNVYSTVFTIPSTQIDLNRPTATTDHRRKAHHRRDSRSTAVNRLQNTSKNLRRMSQNGITEEEIFLRH